MTLPPPPRIPGSKDSRRVFVEDRAKFGYEACCSWHDKERQPIGGSQVSLCPTLSPLRRLNYPALKALSPKYSILPVRPIVQHVVGCGAVHGLVQSVRANTDSNAAAGGMPALILGPEAALIASARCYSVSEQAVTSPVSSMPWCLATEATARQLRGRRHCRNNPTRGQGCAYCAYSIIITSRPGTRGATFFGRGRVQL